MRRETSGESSEAMSYSRRFLGKADFKNRFFEFGSDEFFMLRQYSWLHAGRTPGVGGQKLRLFHALARQHAFGLLLYLEHVDLGLVPLPAEDDLKHMCHVVHEIDRVVQQMTR